MSVSDKLDTLAGLDFFRLENYTCFLFIPSYLACTSYLLNTYTNCASWSKNYKAISEKMTPVA